MLPAAKTHRFSLAEVLPNSLAALRGDRGALGLAPVRHAVVVVADGLGAANLASRAGHARGMASWSSPGTISSGFPSTTAAALASLATGVESGRHGLVGYRVLEPATDRIVNQLNGWEEGGLDPVTWQRVPTVFERARADGVVPVAIGPARYAASGFSAAVLRGAEYRSAASLTERFEQVARELDSGSRSLSYLYVPELDVIGHREGSESPAWTAALEDLDAAIAGFAAALGSDVGMLLTADHGMVDVPAEAQIVVAAGMIEGVRHVAGEPRCLQLHLDPGVDADAVAARWREHERSRAWVATRREAIDAGWFGRVDDEVRARIGDVLVAARSRVAYYPDPEDRGRRMIGQHGSLTVEETAVPLLRFGAFRNPAD